MAVSGTATGRGLASANAVCETAATFVMSVLVNWNGDGVTFVEEKDHLNALVTDRGRSAVNDVMGAGTATITLRNNDGRYSPNNPSSPLYPNVVAGRTVKLGVTYHGIAYQEFVGTIMEPAQGVVPAYSEMRISLIDAFERFRLATEDVALQLNQTTDAIISAILAANSWGGGSVLDAGVTLPTYAQTTTNMLQALQEVAHNEVVGQVFVGRDGKVNFQGRNFRQNEAISAMLSSNSFEKLDVTPRQSDQYGVVQATYANFTWSASAQSAYSGQGGVALYPGANTITDSYSVPGVQNTITPVSGTDYTALDQQQAPVFPPPGTGVQPVRAVDVTRNIFVTSFTSTGTTFTLTLINGLPYTAYLQGFTVRATILQPQTVPRIKKITAPGVPLNSAQTYSTNFDWSQDDMGVTVWACQRAAVFAGQHPRVTALIEGKNAGLVHFLLGLELGKRIVVNDTTGGGANLSGIVEQFYVEHISMTIAPSGFVSATLVLFDKYQGRY